MLRRLDEFLLALRVEGPLPGKILLQPVVDEAVIAPGFRRQTLQAALTREADLYDPELELGTEQSVRRAARRFSEGLPRRSDRDPPAVQPKGVRPLQLLSNFISALTRAGDKPRA